MPKLPAILLLLLACWGGVAHAQDSLDGGSWSGKITATADAPGGSLTDFFYVVQIDSSQTQFWAAVQNDGDDVRAKVDGSQVPCWVDPDTFNYAGQSCLVYVMRSGAASSAPAINIYFGNAGASKPSASATYGQNNTFPTSLKAFYPRGGGNDATSNANNLTMTGSPTVGGVAGLISGSLATDYNGSTQWGAATNSIATAQPISLVGSFNRDTTSGNRSFLSTKTTGSFTSYAGIDQSATAALVNVRVIGTGGGTVSQSVGGTVSTGSWYSLAGVWASATSMTGYNNGVPGTTNTTSRVMTDAQRLIVANNDNGEYFDGKAAFLAYYNIALSANYIAYWHAMLADPDQSDFYNGWTYSAVSGGGIVPILRRMQLNMSLLRPTPWDRFVSQAPFNLCK